MAQMNLLRVVFEKKKRKILLLFMVAQDVCSFSNMSHIRIINGKDNEENLRVK